ncbi:MAG: hypothetical protein PHT39_05430, partial [Sphaerochaetaceae bacterium]|nr:hypothetical protein [Sphaerochaetaceae bacterium]
ATVVLAVVSYLLLPETVVTQISSGGSSTTMPKIMALLIPSIIGIGGSAFCLLQKGDSKKPLVISAVGVCVFAIMLFVNL